MWILVNTLGSSAARSLVSLTEQPRTSWRPRFRINTTSYAVQPPVPASTVSMGRGARFWPPFSGLAASGAPSMAITWPEPVSATKPMPDRVPAAPVQLTVHSMSAPSFFVCDKRRIA